jgi:hypothetical protein
MPWSRVKTKYSIHRIHHTLSTPYTEYYITPRLTVSCSNPVSQLSVDLIVLHSLHLHIYDLSNKYSLSFHHTCLPILPPPYSLHPDSLPPNWLSSDQSLPDQPPPSTPTILVDHALQVYPPSLSITLAMYISKFTGSQWPSIRSRSDGGSK